MQIAHYATSGADSMQILRVHVWLWSVFLTVYADVEEVLCVSSPLTFSHLYKQPCA